MVKSRWRESEDSAKELLFSACFLISEKSNAWPSEGIWARAIGGSDGDDGFAVALLYLIVHHLKN